MPLYLVVFVAFCGYSLMITLFVPMLMGDNGFLPPGTGLARRTMAIGLLLAVYPLGQFIGSPIIGALSDRFGRRPVLAVSLLLTLGAYVIVALGVELRSEILLACGCLLSGLAESNVTIAQSAVADVTRPEDRPRLFAWIYSACSIAFIAAPVGGGQLAAWLGWSTPFWLMIPLLGATLLWVWRSFRETHPPQTGRAMDLFGAATNLATVFTDRPIRRLYLINVLIYIGLFGYFRMILVYMVDVWHTTTGQTTAIYAALAVVSATASFALMAPLSRYFGLSRLTVGATVIAGLAMISITLPAELWSLGITASLTTLHGTLVLSACPAILANAVSAERQGRVMGNNQALQVGAESFSSVLGGLLAAIATALPLTVFGVLLVLVGPLLMLQSRSAAAEARSA
ncbi:MAG: MFS transporter [Acetobacteraceae bacterium]